MKSFDVIEINDCTWQPHSDDYCRGFEAGQQSKQAEVNELRKRIDGALDHAVNHGGYDDLTHIINILKGENYES